MSTTNNVARRRSNSAQPPTIPPSVSKQLAAIVASERKSGNKRINQEAAEAMSEALRLFVREAHRRASIEAECDDEGDFRFEADRGKIADDDESENTNGNNRITPIGAHHVTRIAGDLLMDFS